MSFIFQGQHIDEVNSQSYLSISTSYIEKSMGTDESQSRDKNEVDTDTGFWVALSSGGPWDGFRSLLPLSVITKKLDDDFVALEISMRNGRKHAIFRALATVTNDADIILDISTCNALTMSEQEVSSRSSKTTIIDNSGKDTFLDTTLHPGHSTVLPWRSMSTVSSHCLRIRPSVDSSQTSYAWGRPISMEKDSSSSDQGSFSRQNTLKHVNKTPVSPLMLNQLEKKDLLWCCPSSSGKLFWLSIGTDASVLQTDLNMPVYDWKISASSPLKIENRLPCSAEFKIWERMRDGRSIERQNGVVSSRGTVHIHSADIRNPIYIMLYVQGGWAMEKVTCLTGV